MRTAEGREHPIIFQYWNHNRSFTSIITTSLSLGCERAPWTLFFRLIDLFIFETHEIVSFSPPLINHIFLLLSSHWLQTQSSARRFPSWTYNSVRKTLLANYISTIALSFSKKKKRLVKKTRTKTRRDRNIRTLCCLLVLSSLSTTGQSMRTTRSLRVWWVFVVHQITSTPNS